jgi:hypothetical protein
MRRHPERESKSANASFGAEINAREQKHDNPTGALIEQLIQC